MKSRIVIMALVGILVYSCAPKTVPPPPPPGPAVAETTVSGEKVDLGEAQYIYEANCAKCHRLYKGSEYSAEDWRPILQKMQKMADISDTDREKIYAYLTTK